MLGCMSAFAQMKTKFTQQSSLSDSLKPTGAMDGDVEKLKNSTNVNVPTITRGIERYQKMNVFGQAIPDDFLFYRGLLNERQQVVYDQVYKTLMEGETIVNLQARINSSELEEVLYAVRYENPEAFWWSGAYTWWSNSNDIATKVRLNCWADLSRLEEYYNDFWAMTVPVIYYAACLPDDMAKIKYVHDYICLSTDYDYDSLNSGNVGGKLQTAYSCAVEYLTVCAGYSTAFQYYMQQLGIPCVSVWGSGHQWNLLKVNGQYYQMDVTWDDTQLIPTYYNLTHSEMQKIDSHTPTELAAKVIKKYPSSGDDMTYINYHGLLLEGSPYTYEELGLYDYSLATQESNYVYTDEEQRIPVINNMTDFYNMVSYQLDNTSGNTLMLKGATSNSRLYQQIYDSLGSKSDVSSLIYRKRPSAKGFSNNYNKSEILDYTVFEITITLR